MMMVMLLLKRKICVDNTKRVLFKSETKEANTRCTGKAKPDLIHKQNGANGILNSFHLDVFLKRSIRILDTQMQKFSSVTVR